MSGPDPASEQPPDADVPTEEDQRQALRVGVARAALTLDELWSRYFALGGAADPMEIEAYLSGLLPLPAHERDMLAHVVNERLDELTWQRRVPYSSVIRQRRPATGPLAAIADLLESGSHSSPELLPDLADRAGRALGVGLVVHLVDHEQRRLLPLLAGGQSGTPVPVDGTLAGRAFQAVQVLPSDRAGRLRLWVPIVDGSDRLGVLEVSLTAGRDLYDPTLREQCRWIASLLGHLVTGMSRFGDLLEQMRRGRPRTPSAELIWQQLPPLTAATERFVLAGMLEPAHGVGGDAFDYALSEHTVVMAIFDAMGHGIEAGLLAGAALAASRSARRDGRGLHDQACEIDDVISRTFSGSAFVTGILSELDLATGRLRYVCAGHPPPLLLRGGHVVKDLRSGRRMPFGLGSPDFGVAEYFFNDWETM